MPGRLEGDLASGRAHIPAHTARPVKLFEYPTRYTTQTRPPGAAVRVRALSADSRFFVGRPRAVAWEASAAEGGREESSRTAPEAGGRARRGRCGRRTRLAAAPEASASACRRRPPPASAAALPPVGGWQLVGGRRRGKAGWRAADQPLWPTARGRGRRPTPARPRAAARDAPSQAAGPPSRAAQQPRPSRLVSWLLCAVVSSSRAAGSVMTPAERRRGGGLSCCARRDGARGAHTGGRAAAARQVADAAREGMHAAETSLPTGRHAPGSSSRSAPAATRPTLGAPSAQCGRE